MSCSGFYRLCLSRKNTQQPIHALACLEIKKADTSLDWEKSEDKTGA